MSKSCHPEMRRGAAAAVPPHHTLTQSKDSWIRTRPLGVRWIYDGVLAAVCGPFVSSVTGPKAALRRCGGAARLLLDRISHLIRPMSDGSAGWRAVQSWFGGRPGLRRPLLHRSRERPVQASGGARDLVEAILRDD